MFEPEKERRKVERAILVAVAYPDSPKSEEEALLDELKELVKNLDIGVMETVLVSVKKPNARLLMGSGKAQEIIECVKDKRYDCIVFDNELSPAQQRNWEKESGVTVIDRQEVILDIFAERAHTKEAVLQVELARLVYSLPRLRRAWTHLSRQRGGGVTQRGEGETQLEADQRMVRKQISRVREQLVKVVKQREIQRRKRMRIPLPTAAIVGYTNAGKSSLLKRFTEANIEAKDQLFATLDPKTRRHQLPTGETILLTDTVGFVRKLPHHLVEAFKATLEEAIVSDFLIHVVDASSPEAIRHIKTTLRVLGELGADQKRIIRVFNKIDAIEDPIAIAELKARHPRACFVSVHTGEGMNELEAKMTDALTAEKVEYRLFIPHERYDLVSQLHREGAIRNEKSEDEGISIHCQLPDRLKSQYEAYIVAT